MPLAEEISESFSLLLFFLQEALYYFKIAPLLVSTGLSFGATYLSFRALLASLWLLKSSTALLMSFALRPSGRLLAWLFGVIIWRSPFWVATVETLVLGGTLGTLCMRCPI